MNAIQLNIEQTHVHKLLCAASGDAALLYLYMQSDNAYEKAPQVLHMSESRISCAAATLRQLGLWPEKPSRPILTGERPQYSEVDVIHAMDTDTDFTPIASDWNCFPSRWSRTTRSSILAITHSPPFR